MSLDTHFQETEKYYTYLTSSISCNILGDVLSLLLIITSVQKEPHHKFLAVLAFLFCRRVIKALRSERGYMIRDPLGTQRSFFLTRGINASLSIS